MTTAVDRLTAALTNRYRIERELGAGGMATVYLASDLKHDRQVAIKVLKPELAAVLGAERFIVEIKTTAALQHPHILPLFDSGEADGFLYYVMPYIQGETIREKLNRETQCGVDEAVRIAREVADALDYAHRHGVIHRDIKPENILLHDGRAMVMDFGIALAVSAAAGGRMTETGLSLGTPHYMSPEQATAEKEISGRSDVYSLATVLYEMLAGQPPHVGGPAQQVIMRIITEQARLVTEFRRNVPVNVAAALAQALEKLPADRLESAKAFSDALGNSAFGHGAVTGASSSPGRRRDVWRQRAAAPLAAALVVALGASGWLWTSRAGPAAVTRLDLSTGAPAVWASSDVVISPDGTMLAFVGVVGAEAPAVYLRHIDGAPEFRKVPGTDGINASPTFSPDSRSIAFRRGQADGTLVRLDLSAGTVTTLLKLGKALGTFLHWGTDDQIVYSGGPKGLYRISANGGTPEFLAKTAASNPYSFLLPDGSGVLFSGADGVSVLTFDNDSVTILAPEGVAPSYIATGHVLYIVRHELFAVPFDLRRHRVTGPAIMIVDRVAATFRQRGYSVSTNGTLVYHEGVSDSGAGVQRPNHLAMMDFAGKTETLKLAVGTYGLPRFSPDGRTIAYHVLTTRGAQQDIHTFDLTTATDARITFASDNSSPVWSPDGKQILFAKRVGGSNGLDLFAKPADNSGPERSVLALRGGQTPSDWVRGDTVLFSSIGSGGLDIFTYALRRGGAPTPYLDDAGTESSASISPDGTLAAFTLSESAVQSDIWIRNYPVPTGKWQVSSTSGQAARWSRDGKYLYFWKSAAAAGDSLFRARVDRSPTIVVRAPEFVLSLPVDGEDPNNWDLHPDGKRFVVTVADLTPIPSAGGTETAAAPVSRYLVVQNWFSELKVITAKAGK